MTDQKTFLETLIRAFEQAQIPYMIAGSIGSSFHGHPRATNDVNIVIDPTPKQLLDFIDRLAREFYLSRTAAIEAVENRSMFNIIDMQSGYKADLIIRKQRAFSRQEFARRELANLMGSQAYVLSPEDSILSKLEWTQSRDSQIQCNDALGVLTVQKGKLDLAYLKQWAGELGVHDALNRLLDETEK